MQLHAHGLQPTYKAKESIMFVFVLPHLIGRKIKSKKQSICQKIKYKKKANRKSDIKNVK